MKKMLIAVIGILVTSVTFASTWTIEKKEYNGDSVTYFIKCHPGGMTILTANPRLNHYWDSYGKMHSSLNSAANASCS